MIYVLYISPTGSASLVESLLKQWLKLQCHGQIDCPELKQKRANIRVQRQTSMEGLSQRWNPENSEERQSQSYLVTTLFFLRNPLSSSMKIISRARLLKFRTHEFCSDRSRYFWRHLLSLIPFSENRFCHQRSLCSHVDLSLPRSSIKLWIDHDRTGPSLE